MDYEVTKPKVKSSTSLKLKDIQLSNIVHSGWLKKQGGLVKSWQSRWFILADDELFYFASDDTERCSKPIGRIHLKDNDLVEPFTTNTCDNDKYSFEIKRGADRSKGDGNHDNYTLAAASEEDRRDWVRCINKVIYYDRGGAIFGHPLELTMRNERRTSDLKIPRIVNSCIDFITTHGLDVEGIFRLPGRSTLIRKLRSDFDQGKAPDQLELGQVDLHSVASLLKQFLRELPEPLIPFAIYERVVKICNRDWHVDGRDTALHHLCKVMMQLPPDRYELIRTLTRFLQELVTHSDNNKMNAPNLATIFAHSFLRPEADDDPALLMGTASSRAHCVFLLIEEWDPIFSLSLQECEDRDIAGTDNVPLILRHTHRYRESTKGMTSSRSDSDVSCQDNEYAPATAFRRPLSERELILRFQDGTGKSLTAVTRSKTALGNGRPQLQANIRLEHSSSSETSASVSLNASLQDVAIASDDQQQQQQEEEEEFDAELKDLIAADTDSMDNEELRDHIRRLTSELIDQMHTINELNAHLNRQGKRYLRTHEKLTKKLNDEKISTESAVRRIVSLQGKLKDFQLQHPDT